MHKPRSCLLRRRPPTDSRGRAVVTSATCRSLVVAAQSILTAPPCAASAPASVLVTFFGERRGSPLGCACPRQHVVEPRARRGSGTLIRDGECATYGGLHAPARYSRARRATARDEAWDALIARRPNGTEAVRLAAREMDEGRRGGWGGMRAMPTLAKPGELCFTSPPPRRTSRANSWSAAGTAPRQLGCGAGTALRRRGRDPL